MQLTPKQFAQNCITIGGYNNERITGWDYIRENLYELDYIFRTPEYIEQNGMQYKCMSYLTKDQELTQEEERALKTAWYINNQRTREEKNEQTKNEMQAKGYQPLSEEVAKQAINENKKLEIVATMSSDWLTQKIDNIYTPKLLPNGQLFFIPKGKITRGYYFHRFENAYCKLI